MGTLNVVSSRAVEPEAYVPRDPYVPAACTGRRHWLAFGFDNDGIEIRLWQQDRNEPYPVPDYSVLTLWYDDVLGKDFRARLLTLPLGAWVASVILGPSLLPNFSSNFIELSGALARVLLLPPT